MLGLIMKKLLKSIFLLIFSFSCFSQNNEEEKLNLIFYDNCSSKFIKPEVQIDSFPELNYKIITVFIKRGELTGEYSTTLKTKNDTIRIPKILFSFERVLHSNRWNYLNCGKICNGTETDFYANGNKRLEGKFQNGKPIEIKDFRINGELLTQTFYDNLTLNYKRVNYFDNNGELTEYQIYKNKRKKLLSELLTKMII